MQSAAMMAALLLLLPLIGPLMDHHFVERLPGHNHLFLGAQANLADHAHTHFGSRPHTHEEPTWPPNPFAANPVGETNEQGDVLSFAARDGWSPPVYSAAPLSLLSSLAILLGLVGSTWSLHVRPLFARSAYIPPPKHPPRRSLLSLVILM
jgi:hypothetical protein